LPHKPYDPTDWYWIVALSTTQVYSSRLAAYVTLPDATYTTWSTVDPIGTAIDVATEQEIWDDLASAYPAGIPAGSTTGQATIAAQRTYQDNYFTLADNLDPTKKLRWQLSGIATGQLRTWTVFDGDMEVVGKDTAQTLTNKGFASSVSIGNFANPFLQLFGLTGSTWRLVTDDASKGISIYDASANNHAALTASFGSLAAASISIPMTTPSTSTTTGALQVTGGAGIGGAINAGGAIKSASPSGGVGYATGAGGSVTQLTSKATAVTLNKTCGRIITHNAALAANTTVGFTLTNSAVAAGDVIVINHASGGSAQNYNVWAGNGDGSTFCSINIRNITAGSLSDTLALDFVVIKGASS
jgi:hypothetical protein